MFKIKFLGIIFIGFCITSCKEDIEVRNVSLIHLMVNPEKYEGKIIRMHGFIKKSLRHPALFLTKKDSDSDNTSASIYVWNIENSAIESCSGLYVFIEARFVLLKDMNIYSLIETERIIKIDDEGNLSNYCWVSKKFKQSDSYNVQFDKIN
jgi:hypothetical protein